MDLILARKLLSGGGTTGSEVVIIVAEHLLENIASISSDFRAQKGKYAELQVSVVAMGKERPGRPWRCSGVS